MSETDVISVPAPSRSSDRVEIVRGTARFGYGRFKRPVELSLVLLATPLWALALLFIACAVKLDAVHDPVFYLQERTGRYGRRFRMYKFRTMVPDAHRLHGELAHLNVRKWPEIKIPNDPRVTRVGRILRPLHLDELPQILNVLRGEMSLVGPRPTAWNPEQLDDLHRTRLSVPPGMTGAWQIAQTEETCFDERVQMDIAYIHSMCFSKDMSLLFRTAAMLVLRRFKC